MDVGEIIIPIDNRNNKRHSHRECSKLYPTWVNDLSKCLKEHRSSNKTKNRDFNKQVQNLLEEISKQNDSNESKSDIFELFFEKCTTICDRGYGAHQSTATNTRERLCITVKTSDPEGVSKDRGDVSLRTEQYTSTQYNKNANDSGLPKEKAESFHSSPGEEGKYAFHQTSSVQQFVPDKEREACPKYDRIRFKTV